MTLRTLAILACLLPGGLCAAPVGKVTRLAGEAAADTQPLAEGSGIEAGAVLSTSAKSRLEVHFVDDTVLTLGENARMRVDEFVYDPAAQRGNALLKLANGAFLVVSGGMGKLPDKPLKVTTQVATIGIRGTTFWGGSLDNPLDVLVLDGAVIVESRGGSVVLNPGEGTAVQGAATAPDSPMRWAPDKVKRAVETVSFQ